jgi:hypothetical protein
MPAQLTTMSQAIWPCALAIVVCHSTPVMRGHPRGMPVTFTRSMILRAALPRALGQRQRDIGRIALPVLGR